MSEQSGSKGEKTKEKKKKKKKKEKKKKKKKKKRKKKKKKRFTISHPLSILGTLQPWRLVLFSLRRLLPQLCSKEPKQSLTWAP